MIDISMYVDPAIVALCLCAGKFIKSTKVCKDIPNDVIPYVLVFIGVGAGFVLNAGGELNTSQIFINGFISACASTGLHQQGKCMFFKNGNSKLVIENTPEENNNEEIEG